MVSVRLQLCCVDQTSARRLRHVGWQWSLQSRTSPCACEGKQGPSVCPDRAACPCHTSSALQAEMRSGQLAGRRPAGSPRTLAWAAPHLLMMSMPDQCASWNQCDQEHGATAPLGPRNTGHDSKFCSACHSESDKTNICMTSTTSPPPGRLRCTQAQGAQTQGMWADRWAATRRCCPLPSTPAM